VMVCEP